MKAFGELYQKKKERVVADLSSSNNQYSKWSLKKTTSNLFRTRTLRTNHRPIDLKSFNKVIAIDRDRLLAEVEGLISYEDLVKETVKFSCLPEVVPELKTITVGGAIAGCGIESSSFRYGLVHETVVEMDVLLSDGSVVTCTRSNNYSDLFNAIPNTFGTLGYILRAVIKLAPCKKYVKLHHLHYKKGEEYFKTLSSLCQKHRKSDVIAFIDGVIFDSDEMVITLGEFIETVPYSSSYDYKDIYYLSLKNKETDYLTTSDYIWRWDADWFWCSKVFFMQNPVIRLLFGKWMLHSGSYSKIMHFFKRHPKLKTPVDWFYGKKESVIQDVCIPIQKGMEFLDFFHPEIGIKPIWICPTYNGNTPFDFCPLKREQLYVDFGFWDAVSSDQEPGYYNKKIEQKVKNLNGFKSLYSSSFYTSEEFWDLYDKEKYDKLKSKYDPDGRLSNLFEKCTHG